MAKVAEILLELRKEQAHLKAELARVEKVIALLEQGMGAEAEGEEPARAAASPTEEGPYSQLYFNEAAAEYLASANEPKSAREIAEALVAGGFPTKSANFQASARTMLHRMNTYAHGVEQTIDGKWRFVGRGKLPGSAPKLES
jgi:hypothetical protein